MMKLVSIVYLYLIYIGVFIKEGSIVPRKYLKRLSSMQTLKDAFWIEIFPDS
jgi:hypothetical protein